MKIKVPFKKGFLYREKWVNFEFKIAALEDACERLGIEFHEMNTIDIYDFNLAVLYGAYKYGSKNPNKPKYTLNHAVVWYDNMSRESREQYSKALQDLFGKITKVKDSKGEKKN